MYPKPRFNYNLSYVWRHRFKKLLTNLDSNVSETSVLVSEKRFEFAEVVAGRGHAQAVSVKLENGPKRK
jgi:hypothetical protein